MNKRNLLIGLFAVPVLTAFCVPAFAQVRCVVTKDKFWMEGNGGKFHMKFKITKKCNVKAWLQHSDGTTVEHWNEKYVSTSPQDYTTTKFARLPRGKYVFYVQVSGPVRTEVFSFNINHNLGQG
jgi:hypothetical protein